MNIFKDSWHYKLNLWVSRNFLNYKHPENRRNLCQYFWLTVGNIAFAPFALVISILCKNVGDEHDYSDAYNEYKRGESKYSSRLAYTLSFLATTLILMLLGTALATALSFFAAITGVLIVEPSQILKFMFFGGGHASPLLTFSSFLFAGLIVLYSIYVWDTVIAPWRRDRKRMKKSLPPIETRPNLVVEYIKARKSKLCPMINFVDPVSSNAPEETNG